MKFCKCLILVAAISLMATAGAFAQNILTNPGFEAGDLTGWETYGLSGSSNASVEVPNGPSAPGTVSAFLNNQAEAMGLGIKQVTPVGSVAEGTVEYSFDLKLDQADLGGVFFAEIFAEAEGVGIVGGSGLMGPLWAWEWTNYTGTFEAPANADYLVIQFTATSGATPGSNCVAHVDNVVLEQPDVVSTDSGSIDQIKALYR